MIDLLQKLAVKLEPLRFFALGVGALCLLVAVGIVLTPFSDEKERYVVPAVTGLLWSLSAYVFVTTFRFVPQTLTAASGFWRRLTRRIQRSWYWLLAIVFFTTTGLVAFLTLRLLGGWFGEYY